MRIEDPEPLPPTGRNRRRTRLLVGAAGVLAGAVAIGVVSAQQGDERAATPAGEPAMSRDASPPGARGTGEGSGTVEPRPTTSAERITAARSAAAKASGQVRRPPDPVAEVADVEESALRTSTIERNGETIRVTSARQDLTGFRELAWVTGRGEPVGTARCTQTVKMSSNAEARERPGLLLCWRTSAQRSVYTVAINGGKRPSKATSVAVIDDQWARLR